MNTKRSTKIVIASLFGCGLCCLPLLLPLAAGAAGISFFGFSSYQVLCGVFFLVLALVLAGTYIAKRKKRCVVAQRET